MYIFIRAEFTPKLFYLQNPRAEFTIAPNDKLPYAQISPDNNCLILNLYACFNQTYQIVLHQAVLLHMYKIMLNNKLYAFSLPYTDYSSTAVYVYFQVVTLYKVDCRRNMIFKPCGPQPLGVIVSRGPCRYQYIFVRAHATVVSSYKIKPYYVS
jgi:hypothetical protein